MFVRSLVCYYLFFYVSANINLTYILKREKSHLQPSCIAEELERYAAIGWVYPMPSPGAGIPNITTRFIPTIKNDYNCKFTKNDVCNIRWSVRDWQVDDCSSKTREFIDDMRWEDVPTILISNHTKEFDQRYHIETAQKNGFSVRAPGSVELFICTGWNPRTYPCYYFHIDTTDIYLSKFATLPQSVTYENSYLKHYQAFSNILSESEWRNFEVTVDEAGNITLIDKNLNRTVIEYADPEPFKPMYLMMRSTKPSLWKIMENHFMYTNTTQTSRLGPQFVSKDKDLCVSMLVATCGNCQMSFFYINGSSRTLLKEVGPTERWIEIKLKRENIQLGRFNIFVQTQFVDESLEQKDGWWAYDNVRVCNENEVRVAFLKLNETFAEDDLTVETISCQLIKKSSWRPVKLEFDEIEEFPPVTFTSNDTSIKLSWPLEDMDKYTNYFVFYQGNDICRSETTNSKRAKSSGFLSTKHNGIDIDNLVPYTVYNITVATVLHERDKVIRVNTLETEEPTLEELPINIQIRPLDTAVNVSWNPPPCDARYGRLIHTLEVSNDKFSFKKSEELKTGTQFLIKGLRPYMHHNLTILTARNAMSLDKRVHTSKLTYEFVTLPGVVPAVKHLELYAIGPNEAYLRYDLPSYAQGVPTEVQITRCNKLSFAKCKSSFTHIQSCELWPSKKCLNLVYLMPAQKYSFRVSIKNSNTHAFGPDVEVEGYTVERVPQPPENVTYQVVDCGEITDYCHLNISWLHPYYPNATIVSFNIVLNSSDSETSSSEDGKTITEVYRIANNTYLPRYTYQIKYVPYSKIYLLQIQSQNGKYKSEFASTVVKTAEIGDHVNQKPSLLGKGEESLVFRMPALDKRLTSYTMTVGVQDYNETVPANIKDMENKKLADNLCHSYGTTRVSQTVKVEATNDSSPLTISNLQPNTRYCIIFIVTNNYKGKEHDVIYHETFMTSEKSSPPPNSASSAGSYNHLYLLLLLLLLVPVGFFIFRAMRRRRLRKIRRQPQSNENFYETLPFEEHKGNFANNETYDHLVHK